MIYYGLLLFFFLEYIRPGTFIPGLDILHVGALVPLMIVAGTLFATTKMSNEEVFKDTNGKILLSLFGLIVLSVPTAAVTLYAYDVMTAVFGYLLIFWIICRQVTDAKRLKGVVKAIMLVHLIIAVMNPEMFTDPEGRHYMIAGPFLGDGNDFALSVNVALPFSFFLLADSKKWIPRLFWAGALLLLVLMVVLTKSRGGTIGLLCMAAYYWWISKRKVLTASVGVAVLGFVLLLAPASYFNRMAQMNTEEESAQGRILAWKAAVRMAMDSPVLGWGAGHFAITYGQFYRTKDGIPWQTAHSIYFLALGELGFPGFTVLLLFVGCNVAANRRLMRELRIRDAGQISTEAKLLAAVSASLIGFAAGGAFLSALYYPHIFVVAGLNSATRWLVRQRLTASETATVSSTIRRAIRPMAVSSDWRPRAARSLTAGANDASG